MENLTIDDLKNLSEAARPFTELVTEDGIRAELAAWLGSYFGVGTIGAIYPGITEFRTNDDYDVTYQQVTADVDGLPLHPTQHLQLERDTDDGAVTFTAVLWTTADGLPWDESSGANGEKVHCLADLSGKLL
jgi:hypothetical protein